MLARLKLVFACDECPKKATVELCDEDGSILGRRCRGCYAKLKKSMHAVARMLALGTPQDVALKWGNRARQRG